MGAENRCKYTGFVRMLCMYMICVLFLQYVMIQRNTVTNKKLEKRTECIRNETYRYNCIGEEDIGQRKTRPKPTKPPTPRAPFTDSPETIRNFLQKRPTKVNPFNYEIVIKPDIKCDENTFMAIFVHSFHPNVDRRSAIRKTWGGVAQGYHEWPHRPMNAKLRLFFVFGFHSHSRDNELVMRESERYGDVMIGNFTEAYKNLTLKSVLGLKYFSEHCPQAKYYMKVDDDMMVNLPFLLDILTTTPLRRSIMGFLHLGSPVRRAGKWKVGIEEMPLRFYPAYMSGASYVITNDLTKEIFNASEYTLNIPIEDAYVTGVLAAIVGVKHVRCPGCAFHADRVPMACDFVRNNKVTGTKMTPDLLLQYWHVFEAAEC